MLFSGIAMWQICCTTSCKIVVSSSVGGVVQHVRSRCPCSGVWHLAFVQKLLCANYRDNTGAVFGGRGQHCWSISGCCVHPRRLIRLRNRKCIRRKCHGGVRTSRRRYYQLPPRCSWYVSNSCLQFSSVQFIL